jgi:hypothetical protein
VYKRQVGNFVGKVVRLATTKEDGSPFWLLHRKVCTF